MITIKHLFVFSAFFITVNTVAKNDNRLTYSPEFPKAGEPVTLTYTPLPSMTGRQTIDGVAYTFENNRWVGHDIIVRNEGNVWKGTFTPANKTGFMAFKFVADTIVDNNNGQTFGIMLNKEDGRPWPGGYAAWGLLRSQKYGHYIPNYIDFTKTKEVNDTIVYYWMNNEITYNPSSSIFYAPLFASSARAARIEGAEKRIGNAVNYLKKQGTEEALMNAMAIVNNNKPEEEVIKATILKKYPKGLIAMKAKFDEKFDYRDPNAIEKHFLDFITAFPYTIERDNYLQKFGQSYDNVYTTLMIIDAMNGKTDKQEEYLNNLSFFGCINIFYKLIDIPHLRKDKTDAELLPFATKIVNRLFSIKSEKPETRIYLSEKEWAAQTDQAINGTVAETYSEILKNTGNTTKALEYANLAQKEAQYRRSAINDNMAELLKSLGKTAELKDLLEKSVFYNQISELQTKMLQEIYINEHGNSNGFDSYVEKLKNPAEQSTIQKEVAEYRQEGIMPEWNLTDADGKTISSAQLKGKVYVLDFWANWCHPCKASLPGMKAAADYYKNDKNVEFLFIDTQEYIPNYKEKSKTYLKEQGLDIHLVYDDKEKGSKTNDALSSKIMKQYSISGIPMKVVVDAKGYIRFIAIGYKGSPSALKDEMVEMIKQAKK